MYFNLGLVYVNDNQITEGMNSYNKALELNPKNVWINYNRGMVYLMTEKFNDAISEFDKVLATQPDDGDTHYYRGLAYEKLNKTDKAKEDFSLAVKLKSTHANVPYEDIKDVKEIKLN